MYAQKQLERDEVTAEVISSLEVVLSGNRRPFDEPMGEYTCLIGHRSVVDSLGLVRLLADLEQKLTDEYGVSVKLADERAMSQISSPFRTVRTLTDYICLLTQEARRNGGA